MSTVPPFSTPTHNNTKMNGPGHSVSAGFSHVNGDLILVFTLFFGGAVCGDNRWQKACMLVSSDRTRGIGTVNEFVELALFTCYSNRLLHVCHGFPL